MRVRTTAPTVAALLLAACAPQPSAPADGPGEALAPIGVMGAGELTALVGQVITVDDAAATEVSTDSPDVLAVTQPGVEDGMVYAGGAVVADEGRATLVVHVGSTVAYEVVVEAEYGSGAR